MQETYRLIKKDKQIWKMSFYGLLKNLKFFEPYLYIYLLSIDSMNLFKIGILFSIREIITYLFEVPSGIIADQFGKKKELLICFTFYIISFVIFFFGTNFIIIIIAMIFFGLGEAFRSGTHKAMIYSYLEQKGWFEHKTYVYGRTRSFSLIGSSLSALISIIFILNLPSVRWIFLLCIIPYLLDFILISTYPNSLDERKENHLKLGKFFKDSIRHLIQIFSNKPLRKLLVSSSLYDGIFKSIKDYIQPILSILIISSGFFLIEGISSEDNLKITLGLVYGVFYIFSATASRNVYHLNKLAPSGRLMSIFFDVMGVLSLVMFYAIDKHYIWIVLIIFFLLYILKDARRPIFVDVCGDTMEKHQRATVLSVDSQLRSFFTVPLALLFGFIADTFSIEYVFLLIGVIMLILNRFLHLSKKAIEGSDMNEISKA